MVSDDISIMPFRFLLPFSNHLKSYTGGWFMFLETDAHLEFNLKRFGILMWQRIYLVPKIIQTRIKKKHFLKSDFFLFFSMFFLRYRTWIGSVYMVLIYKGSEFDNHFFLKSSLNSILYSAHTPFFPLIFHDLYPLPLISSISAICME